MLSIALALVAPQPLAAQGTVQRAGYHAAWWTTADGLPGNFVTDIVQGPDGRLWIIAGGVLVRFDGIDFEVVRVGEATTADAPMEFPIGIERGAGDTLWVSTYAHRVLARTRGLWVPMFQAEHELSELVVRPGFLPAAREDEGSRVYFWQGGRRLPAPDPGRFEAADRPSVALDAAGVLWAIERAGSIARPQPGAAERQLEVATGRFVESSAGDGPLGVRRAGGWLEIIDLAGRVRAAIPDGAGRVPRLLTLDGRVVASTADHVEVYAENSRQPDRIPLRGSGPVLAAFEDGEGGLWVGTNAGGLLHVRRAPFEVYQPDVRGDGPSAVRIIAPGRDGSVLVAADGVVRIRASRMEVVSIDGVPADTRVFAATEDSRGTLWLSLTTGRDERLVFARLRDGQVRRFESAHPVVEIVEAPQGGVYWLSEVDYCRVWLHSDGTDVPTCTDIGAWGARDLLVAQDGTIWIAGTRGVRAERAGGVRYYTPDEGYPLTRARALHEDAEGTIWIGTYYGGLGRLAGDSLRMIRSADGLAEDVVSTILEDDRGWLWMGGNAGIHSVDKATIAAFLAGEASGVTSLSFGSMDGLPNAEGSGGQGVRGTDGRLWLPTFGGAVALAPGLVDDIAVSHGEVRIDRITGRDTVFAVSDTLRLPSGMRDLRIEVAAVSLRAPGTERIEYRLEGRVSRWASVQDGRMLTLTGLPSGSHRLEVRAIVPDVGRRLSTTQLVLVVPPLFTETAWFPLLLLVAMAGLLQLGVSFRTRLLERRARDLAEEVREQTHWLEVERDRSTAALERAATTGAQLRELLVAKSRVFAGLSHELRTPMSLILAPLRELEREASGAFPPAARGHLGTLKKAVHRLERLTAQFLDLADTQAGTLRLDRRETDVGAFLERCVESLRPVAEREQVKLTLAVPRGAPVRAEFDPDQMDKAVLNLVGNAIRHAPAGGHVDVRLLTNEDGASVVLEVRDDGPGVPAEYAERIFEPFFQAPGATGGMGLGLALSRDVVVLHGGRIEVESPPDAGATFRVTLPVRAPTRPEPVAAPTVPTGAIEPPHPVPDDVPTGPRARLLIVEDERDLALFLADRFQRQYEVRTAAGGEEALTVLGDWRPDVVISDIMMPGLDGLGLCRILKADPATRSIPVVLLTALGDRDHQVQGLATGADDYVVKPFDLEQLSLRVANLIGLRRGIEDRFQAAMPAWASILLRAGTDRMDSRSEEFLERLYQTLLEGLGNPDLDVDGMAKALFLSRSSLYRRVRALLDCSPLDLLAEIRLEQAALLLRTTSDPVSTIANTVGFRNPEHFSRRFVAHFGLSPRSYRRQYRGRRPPS
jgi:signal transduction histidine kinase/DNA-binding response OmpR family regulator